MDLLEDLKMSLLIFRFFMIYIIHKILVLLKNHLNYLKDNILNALLRSITEFQINFFISYKIENPRPEEEKISKDIRNLFRLKKELNCTANNDIGNLFI